MDWEKELIDILEGVDTKDLAAVLISKFGEVARPSGEGYQNIDTTLKRLEGLVSEGRENVNTILWMAFWLGAAWQKAVQDAAADRGIEA